MALLLLALFIAGGCDSPEIDSSEPFALDDADTLDALDDGFDRHHLISDEAYFDADAVTADDVQAFLEDTPWGTRSILADEIMDDGQTFSEALVGIAREHGMNPIVLLVQIQKEASLVRACDPDVSHGECHSSDRPSRTRVNYAFGCGCHDGKDCSSAYRGLDKQLDCVADVHKERMDEVITTGRSLTGWQPGRAKRTLDPVDVNPANRATTVLYTYTPWVLRGRGGNWLFWSVWVKFSQAFDYEGGLHVPFNEGFIGGTCSNNDDCFADGSWCEIDFPRATGFCTTRCERFCPDRPGSHFATTFCVDDGVGNGICKAQCTSDGSCGPEQACHEQPRHGETSHTALVCEM